MKIGNARGVTEDVHLGDSIAINGTCLTVTEFDDDWFKVGLAPETLRRTNLGDLSVGSDVNLERAMTAGRRFGGHFVQGHVDACTVIVAIIPEKDSVWYRMTIPEGFAQFIIEKGFIALDGVSLTVCEVNDQENYFSIMLIDYTQKNVIMPQKMVGDRVNLEVDMVGKYVERCLAVRVMTADKTKMNTQ